MGKCRGRWAAWLMVVASLWGAVVQSADDPVCYRWYKLGAYATVGDHATIYLAAAEVIMNMNGSPQQGTGWYLQYTLTTCNNTPSGASGTRTCEYATATIPKPGYACGVQFTCNAGTGQFSVAFEIDPDGCPPSPCEQWADIRASMEGAGALPSNVCRNMGDGSMCRFVRAGGVSLQVSSGWAAVFKGDGSECSVSDNVGTAANCIMMESGKYACAGKPSNANCGKVNGEDVCLEKMPEGACAFMADGSVICDADAPNQPDNGTPGEQAIPDAVLGLGTGEGAKEFNYYSSTTVAGSSGGGAGLSGIGPDGIGQDGGIGDGDGDGDGEGPGEVCDGTDCYGEDGIGGQIAECADDFEECVTGFAGSLWETIEELPMMEFIASLHEAFGSTGACPEGSFTLWDETYDVMEPACGLITDHTGTFHLLFQVMWSLAGLRIILEA